MRVLILGGSGMLGHKVWQIFAARFDAYLTFRDQPGSYASYGILDVSRAQGGVEAEDFESVVKALEAVRPDVVVNCIGIVKQDAAARDPVPTITVNALFPHKLAGICRAAGVRLLHLSTDCVFSGRTGNYSEADTADAEDLYGRSKLMGEVGGKNCLTIRTSMIGRELEGAHGLLEWFLSQKEKRVRGFNKAIFSGLTTNALAEVLAEVISHHPTLSGVYHVAAEPINKFNLLSLIKETYGLTVEIEPDESFICDRSLNGTRFREATGFVAPAWPEMVQRLRDDPTPYHELRRFHAER